MSPQQTGQNVAMEVVPESSPLRVVLALVVLGATWMAAWLLAVFGIGILLDDAFSGPGDSFDFSGDADAGQPVLGWTLPLAGACLFVLSGVLPYRISRLSAFLYAPLIPILVATTAVFVASAF